MTLPELPPGKPLSQAKLVARGWPLAAIREHLGEPDRKVNTGWAGVHRYQYGVHRVLQAEQQPEVQAALEAEAARRAEKRRKVEERQARRLAEIAGWTPHIVRHPIETLTTLAIDHYNRRGPRRRWFGYDEDDCADWREATADSDPGFLDRITVNYLRHAGSTYDSRRAVLPQDAVLHAALFRRVQERIAEVYPELAEEARRQLARHNSG